MPKTAPSGEGDSSPLVLPDIELKVVSDLSPAGQNGFLRLVRRAMVATYEDGSTSREFTYDEVTRTCLDAVVLCAHYRQADTHYVYLRSALRPPVTFRDPSRSPVAEGVLGLFELPAGLVEPEERGVEGLHRCAARELEEELGFRVAPQDLLALGPSAFPCPGVIAERHFYFHVEVEPSQRRPPTLDGSALEHDGRVVALPISEVLTLCRQGHLQDSKTELGVRRLAEIL